MAHVQQAVSINSLSPNSDLIWGGRWVADHEVAVLRNLPVADLGTQGPSSIHEMVVVVFCALDWAYPSPIVSHTTAIDRPLGVRSKHMRLNVSTLASTN